MKSIGGYFELELPTFSEYHENAIALNSGRFCLEYILRCKNYTKVFVPYFTCDTVIEPIIKLGISYEFYHIDKEYRITDNLVLGQSEALLYTNYWGLQDDYCKILSKLYRSQLILDYTQAFFSKPIIGIDTFYSCRKYFGVPDGGYLYTNSRLDFPIEVDISYNRIASLVKRIDISPEAGYEDFLQVSKEFHNLPLRYMSKFTKRMMCAIDYNKVISKRRANYKMFYEFFGGIELQSDAVPMVYPLLTNQGADLRKRLIKNKIFVPQYWPSVKQFAPVNSISYYLAENIVPLCIDQRVDESDIKRIINEILVNE